MQNVKVNHEVFVRSHGKRASGDGMWAFSAKADADVSEMAFVSGNMKDAARQAAAQFGVKEVWVQP